MVRGQRRVEQLRELLGVQPGQQVGQRRDVGDRLTAERTGRQVTLVGGTLGRREGTQHVRPVIMLVLAVHPVTTLR
jgi:hypothetical protein